MSNLARIEALTTRIKNMKERAQKGARIGTQSMLVSGGGLLGGFIDAKLQKIPNTNLDTAGVAGAMGVVLAMSGFLGEHSDAAGAACSGTLAYVLGRETREYFLTR
jgi:hypothetical protein